MSLTTAGLRTHIWNNRLWSGALIVLYPFLLAGIVWLCALAVAVFEGPSAGRRAGLSSESGFYEAWGGGALSGGVQGPRAFGADMFAHATSLASAVWPYVFVGVAVWFVVSFLFNVRLVGMMAGSSPVGRKEEPDLYNLLENLCIARGLPMPRLEIIETHARNAFASGVTRATHTITVTRGLIQSLTREEMEAVLAHELTHIRNRDVLLLMVCVVFTGMLGFASQMAWRSVRLAGRSTGRRRGGGGGSVLMIMAIAVILSIGYGLTLLTRFALSRRREYMADGGAVELTRRPEAMIAALQRIAGRDRIPDVPADVSLMCIENSQRFFGLFATHPSIDSRIAVLARTAGLELPAPLSLPPAPAQARFVPHGQVVANPWKKKEDSES